jgi:hypothetical protein
MTNKKTSAKKKPAKLKATSADASIMVTCCSAAFDVIFPDSTFTVKTSAKSVRISNDRDKFSIVGLPCSSVDTSTKPWRVTVNGDGDESSSAKTTERRETRTLVSR